MKNARLFQKFICNVGLLKQKNLNNNNVHWVRYKNQMPLYNLTFITDPAPDFEFQFYYCISCFEAINLVQVHLLYTQKVAVAMTGSVSCTYA